MQYRCVIFDLDGTLLDTLEDIGDSMNTALAEFNVPPYEIDRYRYFVGDGMEVLARRVLPKELCTEDNVSRCVTLMRREYAKRWANKTRPYAGIAELLNGLTSRRVACGVLSNKPHDFTCSIIQQILPEWRFDPLLGARPGVPKKPDPAAALEIIALKKLRPEEFLYVGDTAVDMQTAIAAGMFPVGALWGFRTAEELKDAGARVLLQHPVDLLKLL
ncbi:MAG TPA: HAD family hydrolase [Planctomycetota bacterium]|nr:HAD family hydrolase [Planctomycetota bacterium]